MADLIVEHPNRKLENITRRIMRTIWSNGSITKLELQQAMGLSHPTVLAGVNRLTELGIVSAAPAEGPVRGRRPAAICFNYNARTSVGLELRVNTCRIVQTDLQSNILASAEFSGPGKPEDLVSDPFLREVSAQLDAFLVQNRIPLDRLLTVGILVPGRLHDDIWICGNASVNISFIPALFSVPVRLSSALNDWPLAEGWLRQYEDLTVLGLDRDLLCMATRQAFPVSCGFRPLNEGTPAIAGSCRSVGHQILFPDGLPCSCGRRGCAGCYCSMTALLGDRWSSPAAFFTALNAGDPSAAEALTRYLDALARLICLLDTQYAAPIVLTGVLSEYLEPHLPQLRIRIRDLLGPGNALSGPLTIGRLRRFAPAVSAAILSIAFFFDSDYFND